jgi:hypothetical protein
MTDPKERPRSGLRAPKPKKTLGLQVPHPLRLPHEDLIPTSVVSTPNAPSDANSIEETPVTPTDSVAVSMLTTPTSHVGVTDSVRATKSVTPT